MKLSVVVPCFNEEAVLPETLRRLDEALQGKEFEVEFVFVNDGSRDATASLLNQAADADPRSKVLHFSRNFGHQSAVTAGIHEATGDYAAIIDADLQDPPELIPVMLETAQREKCNVVYAVRNKRKGESPFKLLTAWLFYRVLNFLSEEKFPENTGDFRLVDRKVMEAFKSLPERNRYLRGLFHWVGFRQMPVAYDRDERVAGKTKYTLGKMVRLARNGVFSFSKKPLELSIRVGFLAILVSLALALWVFWHFLFATHRLVPGWGSTLIVILFLGGVQLFSVGILGEYLGQVMDEVKQRPDYIVAEKRNCL